MLALLNTMSNNDTTACKIPDRAAELRTVISRLCSNQYCMAVITRNTRIDSARRSRSGLNVQSECGGESHGHLIAYLCVAEFIAARTYEQNRDCGY
jgi:hypothetical protein